MCENSQADWDSPPTAEMMAGCKITCHRHRPGGNASGGRRVQGHSATRHPGHIGVVVAAYLVGKLLYRLRDVILIMVVAGFIALLLNPLVVALQRWKIRRRGFAVTIVTLWGVVVFIGLAVAFGYPLVNGISHLAQQLPTYVSQAEHGKGWIGHLAVKYHVQAWVAKNTPKLVSFGQGLAKPALSLGKGAATLVITLLTIFVLVLLLLLEGPKIRAACSG